MKLCFSLILDISTSPHRSSPSSVLLSPYICHHGGVETLWLGHRLAFLGLLDRPPRSLLCGSSEGSSISLKGFSVLLTFGSCFGPRLLQTTLSARQRMHLLRLTFTGLVRLKRNHSWFFVHPEGNQILFSSIENCISENYSKITQSGNSAGKYSVWHSRPVTSVGALTETDARSFLHAVFFLYVGELLTMLRLVRVHTRQMFLPPSRIHLFVILFWD